MFHSTFWATYVIMETLIIYLKAMKDLLSGKCTTIHVFVWISQLKMRGRNRCFNWTKESNMEEEEIEKIKQRVKTEFEKNKIKPKWTQLNGLNILLIYIKPRPLTPRFFISSSNTATENGTRAGGPQEEITRWKVRKPFISPGSSEDKLKSRRKAAGFQSSRWQLGEKFAVAQQCKDKLTTPGTVPYVF